MAVGTYEVMEGGEKKKKHRHRNIGVVMKTTWDAGGETLMVKINAEILNQSLLTLISRAGILIPGDDAVMCRVYSRDRKAPAARQAEGDPVSDEQPY